MRLRSLGGSSLAVGIAIWLIAVCAGLAALSAAAARPGVGRAHTVYGARTGAWPAAKFRSQSERGVDAARMAVAAPHGETPR